MNNGEKSKPVKNNDSNTSPTKPPTTGRVKKSHQPNKENMNRKN